MTIQEMKEKKKEIGYTYSQIAELSGVPLGTVQKIFNGSTSSPRYDTLRALEKVFQLSFDEPKKPTDMIREASAPYFVKKQGDYTLEDYYAIPDDIRVELIDGVIYDMSAPTSVHQLLTGFLFTQFMNHVMKEKWKLSSDRLADRRTVGLRRPHHASAGCGDRMRPQKMWSAAVCTARRTLSWKSFPRPAGRKISIIKLNKYMNARSAGVLGRRSGENVWCLFTIFEHNNFPDHLRIRQPDPCPHLGGKLVLDFREASDHIQFLYEDR